MLISFGSIITCILISCALMSYLVVLSHCKDKNIFRESRFLFVGIIIILFRLLIPFNFPFTISIPITHILPIFSRIFYKQIYNFQIYHIILLIWVGVAIYKLISMIKTELQFHQMLCQLSMYNQQYKSIVKGRFNAFPIKNLEIIIIPAAISPAITGLFHPKLILPEFALDLSDEELEYIIKHEYEHFKRLDLWLKYFLRLISCFYWWNPLITILKIKLELVIELSTDMFVIKNLNAEKKLNYASCLVKISKICQVKSSSYKDFQKVGVSLLCQDIDLEIRTNLILECTAKRPDNKSLLKVANILMMILMVGICLFIVPEAYSVTKDVEENSFSISEDNAYLMKLEDGYALYINDEYVATVDEIDESLRNIKILEEE